MAKIAVELADEPIFTSDNPRSEDPRAILRDMEAGVENEYYHSIANREQAIFFAIANAKKAMLSSLLGKDMKPISRLETKPLTLTMPKWRQEPLSN